MSAKAQLEQAIVLVELCGDKDSDVVNLIIVGRAAATKTDVFWWSLALTDPGDSIQGDSLTRAFVFSGTEDTNVQLLTIDVWKDAIWSVLVAAVPTINFVEVKLDHDRIGLWIDKILFGRESVVLDESSQELGEARIEVNLAINPSLEWIRTLKIIDVNVLRQCTSTIDGGMWRRRWGSWGTEGKMCNCSIVAKANLNFASVPLVDWDSLNRIVA